MLALTSLLACQQKVQTLEEKAAEIHQKVLTVDTHTDTPWDLLHPGFDLSERHDYKKDRSRVDLPRMREGGLDAVFMASFVGQGERTDSAYLKAFDKCMEQIDSIHSHVEARPEEAGIGTTPDDAYQLEKEGKRTIYIGIENGYPIGHDLKNIKVFYNKGARYITLCHTRNNHICDSSTDSTEYNGLSSFGEEVVAEMNRLGIMVDVSHISDSSFYDVINVSKTPVIASHSCSRAICDHPRNLNDDMLRTLAENNGVIQMCILSDYVKSPKPYPERDSAFQAIREKYNFFKDLSDEQEKMARKEWHLADSLFPRELATVSDMVDHIDHIVEVAGIDHVGIGTDFDGGGGLADCVDVSQMGNITLELVRRGYTEDEIQKIWGGNIMRVMGEVQDFSEKGKS
ncbi:MAG: dipeptidase [Bacteroidetes bacterium]|nr:dipeptidase [Bacteroidota bacterium]